GLGAEQAARRAGLGATGLVHPDWARVGTEAPRPPAGPAARGRRSRLRRLRRPGQCRRSGTGRYPCAMSLRTVHATRYVTPLREGGSMPAIVEADDDGMYVLKFRGAGQGPRALV